MNVSGHQDWTLWKSNIGAQGDGSIKQFWRCPGEFLRFSKCWFGRVVHFCWVLESLFGWHITPTKGGVPNTDSEKAIIPRSIPMFVDKDSILFRTEIIYRFGSKDFVLIHHTVSSTNRSRSVSFPRWVFLIISGNLIVRTGNWKTNTNLPIWNIWFPESEDLNLQFWGSGWYRNNWKPKSGDYSSQNPNQNLRKL